MGNNSNSSHKLKPQKLNINSTIKLKPKDKRYSFQLVMVGKSFVGKTCISNRYITGDFDDFYRTTFGREFNLKGLNFHNQNICLQLYEIPWRYESSSFFNFLPKNAHGIIFVYDVSDKCSFDSICNLNKVTENNACEVLVGNKCNTNNRVITEEMGKNLADELGMNFFETSAKSGKNIDELFLSLTEEIFKTFYPEDLQTLLRSSIE